jgi:AcrR family transcriptional regulator
LSDRSIDSVLLVGDGESRAWQGPVSREQAREMQRKRILNATVSEVGERGLRSVTIAGVVARAGVSRSTFYELFDDLDVCIVAVLSEVTSRSIGLMSDALEREPRWQDGVLAALAALLMFLDREPVLARVFLVETLAGSPTVLEHRARELALLNPLLDAGKRHGQAMREPPELTAEASVASITGILHARLVTGESPPFIGLLGQFVGLVVAPYLDPSEVAKEIVRAEKMTRALPNEVPPGPSSSNGRAGIPAGLRHPGAYRARACVVFLAANPGASNKAVAAGIGVSSLGQVSVLLKRLRAVGLLAKRSGEPGHPNAWWLTAQGEHVAHALRDRP